MRENMKSKNIRKRVLSLLIALMIFVVSGVELEPAEVSAESKYIKVDAFIKCLVTEMKLVVNDTSDQKYINAAIKNGIIKEGDFKSYNEYLTRMDCAVIANRLDELINKNYNYSDEIYHLLRNCNYFEGLFYYNIEGDLFPKGVDSYTYKAEQFVEEVLYLILADNFQSDVWAKTGLRALYKDKYDKDGNITDTYIMFGQKPVSEDNFVGIDPLDETSDIVIAWNRIKDGDRKVDAVLKNRISDIKKIPKNKRNDVATVVSKGIIKGYSNGKYVQNRSFKGSSKMTVAGAKDVIQKVIHEEKRAKISPDGQLIRTTNLPKNAYDYKYILDCFPNEYYEMRYTFMYYPDYKEGKTNKSKYSFPREIDYKFLYENFYKGHMNYRMDKYEYYDKALEQAEKYLNCVFNMNYKTVGDKWLKNIRYTYSTYTENNLVINLKEYISEVKKNHVVIESKRIAIDPNSLYYEGGSLYVKAYVKYRITADSIDVDQDYLLYGLHNDLQGLRNGEWRTGIYNIELNCRSDFQEDGRTYFGVDPFVRISDWELRGTY